MLKGIGGEGRKEKLDLPWVLNLLQCVCVGD